MLFREKYRDFRQITSLIGETSSVKDWLHSRAPYELLDDFSLERSNSERLSDYTRSGYQSTMQDNPLAFDKPPGIEGGQITTEISVQGKGHPGRASTIMSTMATEGITDNTFRILPTLCEFTAPQRKARRLPVFKVPIQQNPHFWAREEILQQMDDVLLSSTGGTSYVAISGLGGMGKTQVALQYAHTRRKEFDAIFWIRADDKSKLAEGFLQIAVTLGLLSSSEIDDITVARDIALGWLSRTERYWLLVFDNADGLDILSEYWPTSSNGAVIVTSQDPMVADMIYQSASFDLQPFSTKEAANLLCHLTTLGQTEEEREAALTIAILLNRLPLAITYVASAIKSWDITLGEFLHSITK
jgi:hypothetical protein